MQKKPLKEYLRELESTQKSVETNIFPISDKPKRQTLDEIFNQPKRKTLDEIFSGVQQKSQGQDIFNITRKIENVVDEKAKKGLISQDTKDNFTRMIREAGEELSFKQAGQTGIEFAGRSILGIAEAGFNLFGRGVKKITPDVIENKTSEIMSKIGQSIVESKPEEQIGTKESLKSLLGAFAYVVEEWNEFEKYYPDTAHTLEGIGGVLTALPVEKAGMIGVRKTMKEMKKVSAGLKPIPTMVKTKLGTAGITEGVKTGAKETIGYIASQSIGINRETINLIKKYPAAFKRKMIKGVDTASIKLAESVEKKINHRLKALSTMGKGYDAIRKSDQFVEIPEDAGRKILEKYHIGIDDTGKITQTVESIPLSSADKKALQDFINMYNTDKLSANAFLNARKALSEMGKYGEGKTSVSKTMAKELRTFYDNLGKTQIKGLKELDAEYSKEIKILNQIKKDYINPKTGEFKDNAISKISNLSGANKHKVLERLKGIDPNIEKKIKILNALKDIKLASGFKVGTYIKSGLTGAGLITGNIPLVIGSIISNPIIAVPLIRKYGEMRLKKKGFINGIIDKLQSKKDFGSKEKVFLEKMFNDKSGKTDGIVKRIIKDEKGFAKIPFAKDEFTGLEDLTLKTVEKLKGKTTVSKQFISDLTNAPDLKQAERDLVRKILDDMPDGKINVQEFADKIKTELLPLDVRISGLKQINKTINKIEALEELKKGNPVSADFGGNIGRHFITQEDISKGVFDFQTPLHKTFLNKHKDIARLPKELRGNIKNYKEIIYESPIKTSAEDIHFPQITDNYFAHTRIEDMADGKTRRVIEVQSDLMQKGNLKREMEYFSDNALLMKKSAENNFLPNFKINKKNYVFLKLNEKGKVLGINYDEYYKLYDYKNGEQDIKKIELANNITDKYFSKDIENLKKLNIVEEFEKNKIKTKDDFIKEIINNFKLQKLQPYRNIWHERIIKEEIKTASQNNKKVLQFPTGETAMKIEGLGEINNWSIQNILRNNRSATEWNRAMDLTKEKLKIGLEIKRTGQMDNWIIIDVLGDGKFKALPKNTLDEFAPEAFKEQIPVLEFIKEKGIREVETFDISGKVNTSDPIYKFYEKDIQKYLKRIHPEMERITDKQGVEWFQINIKPEDAKLPIEAFGLGGLLLQEEE